MTNSGITHVQIKKRDSMDPSKIVGLILIGYGVLSFLTSTVTLGYSSVYRDKNPGAFWIGIVGLIGGGLLFFFNVLKVKG